MENEIGKVTHFYDKASVAVVKLTAALKVGDAIVVKAKGGEERFRQTVESMQVDFKSVDSAGKGGEVAVKVTGKTHAGDVVCKA